MSDLDRFTDEELGRMLRAADQVLQYRERSRVTALDSFCDWLGVVGLGWISATIKTAQWAWDRIKGIWRSIFS